VKDNIGYHLSRLLVSGFKTQTSTPPNPCGISCIVQLHAQGPGITNERIHMKLSKLIKKVNKENTPPDGWKASDAISKAINWDKLKDPKVLKQLEEMFDEKKNR